MTLGRKNKHFEEVTNADIAEEIIGRYGLEKEIESSAYQYREAVQFNTTDWDFILYRMDRTGRICLVEVGKIIIRKPDLWASAVLDVVFGVTLKEYSVDKSGRGES